MANMWVKQCHEPMTGNGFNIPPMVMTGELFLYGGFTKSWGYPKKTRIVQVMNDQTSLVIETTMVTTGDRPL